jgi:hypothetical protein
MRDAKDLVSRELLEGLEQQRQSFEGELFEFNRIIRTIQYELSNMQTLEDQALAKAKPHSEEMRHEREIERLRRRATFSIKEEEFARNENRHQSWSDMMSTVMSKIADEKKAQEWDARSKCQQEETRQKEEEFTARRAEIEQP